MPTYLKTRWVDLLIFGLSVFLLFCLIFEPYLQLPELVAWLGRWHPLVLHFPIVLLLVAAFLGLTGKKVPLSLLAIGVVFALLTAISGFFLGKEILVKGNLLLWHQWLGAATALLAALWYWLDRMAVKKEIYFKVLQVAMVGLVGFTGHYGGMITHGEDFLTLPANRKTEGPIPGNPLIYGDVVVRILDKNCVSCHNRNKQKGGLLMTGVAELLKGGETGNTLVPGNPEESEMIRRLHLPMDDEEHMPPEGERPLTADEVLILERWIALGASDTLRLDHLEANEPLAVSIKGMMVPDPFEKWAKLPVVADSTLRRLNSDYLTIGRVAGSTNALQVNMYKPPTYDPELLLALESVSPNIVQLDLSGLPIGDREMGLVAACRNLEWLEIDRTPVADDQMDGLKGLSELRTLKVYDTKIGDASVAVFKALKNLKSLYLWKTDISETALGGLESSFPGLLVNRGIDADIEPFFVAKDSVSDTENKNGG